MNLIDAIQALSLREKEELYSHIGQLIYEEKFYKEDEGVRKMEEVKMSVCAAMNLTTYDPRRREKECHCEDYHCKCPLEDGIYRRLYWKGNEKESLLHPSL